MQVDNGMTLTLVNQPQHPYSTFFTGKCLGKLLRLECISGGVQEYGRA
jgi:hypothetical protein